MSSAVDRLLAALRNVGCEPLKNGAGWTSSCPAHHDRSPSLSIGIGDDGRALVHCHAGCSPREVCAALGLSPSDLFSDEPPARAGGRPRARPRRAIAEGRERARPTVETREPNSDGRAFGSPGDALASLEKRHGPSSAVWTYRDGQGGIVGLIARWDVPEGKVIRPVSRNEDGSSWAVGGMPSPRPVYGLPELLAADAGEPVFVTEGEKAADAAKLLGFISTTSPHGAKSASKADWSAVAGRDVVILPDHDDAGERYAADVARLASAAGAKSVRIVRLARCFEDLPTGGDIADLVGRCGGDEALLAALKSRVEQATAEATPETGLRVRDARTDRLGSATPVADDADAAELPQPEKIVRLALELFRLGQTPKREPFAVPHAGPNVLLALDGSASSFCDMIAREYRRRFGRVMAATACKDALATLRGDAMEAATEPASLRVGMFEDSVVLDLGSEDGAAVVVGPSGWRVVDRSPILFRRTALTGSIPKPERGGRIDRLREFLNVTDDTWPVLLGWIAAALIPDMPHPILLLGGTQGSGKTSAARFICGLIDPSDAQIRSQPRDPGDWAVSVENAWTTVIDNVSRIPDWWSDALCKAVTGDGWIRRKLYSDGAVAVLSFRRVIVLTSIDAGALRGDLGERIALIDLDPIDPESRRTEAELATAYRSAHPAILGALLDLLAQVLSRLGSIRLTRLPRMADFARVLAAVDQAIGTNSLGLFEEQGSRVAREVVESDSVGEKLVEFMSEREAWSGTASELLEALGAAEDVRDWPRNGRALSARLKRLTPALLQQGLRVTPPPKTDHKRIYTLSRTAQTAQPPEVAVPDGAEAGGPWAVGEVAATDRPGDRPAGITLGDPEDHDSGRLGGLGGSSRTFEQQSDEWGDL